MEEEIIKQIITPTKKQAYIKIYAKDENTFNLWAEEVVFIVLVEHMDVRTNELEYTSIQDVVDEDGYITINIYEPQVLCKIDIIEEFNEEKFKKNNSKLIQDYIKEKFKEK